MAKRPPEWYAPGELSKTRHNLGDFTSQEAKELSSTLGGDVGVERTDEDVLEQYEKLQRLNRRKSDRILKNRRACSLEDDSTGIAERVKEVLPGGGANYFNRVRMNFIAAPLLTFSDLNFFVKIRLVNPIAYKFFISRNLLFI